jgi:hypothetical protein
MTLQSPPSVLTRLGRLVARVLGLTLAIVLALLGFLLMSGAVLLLAAAALAGYAWMRWRLRRAKGSASFAWRTTRRRRGRPAPEASPSWKTDGVRGGMRRRGEIVDVEVVDAVDIVDVVESATPTSPASVSATPKVTGDPPVR